MFGAFIPLFAFGLCRRFPLLSLGFGSYDFPSCARLQLFVFHIHVGSPFCRIHSGKASFFVDAKGYRVLHVREFPLFRHFLRIAQTVENSRFFLGQNKKP